MNASPAAQERLLEVAALDALLRRSEHERTHPPQAARLQALVADRQVLSHELTSRLGARDDLRTELSRIESDVAVVDARSARDAQRLATSSNVKEAQGLESEIGALARRKSDLEDAELDVMERLEVAEAGVAEQEARLADLQAEGARLSAEGKRVVAETTSAIEAAARDRAAVVGALPEDLVALYDRAATRGPGAGLLRRGACEGCHMVLSGTDLQAVRATARDTVVSCPECGCVLVRTDESGL